MEKEHYTEAFLENIKEHLQNICSCMMILEQEPQNKSGMQEICFSLHLVKGMAGTMGFSRFHDLSEEMEEVFKKAADGAIQMTGRLLDLLRECVNALRIYENNIKETFQEGAYEYKILRQELKQEAEASGALMLPEKTIQRKQFIPKGEAAEFDEAEEENEKNPVVVEAEDLEELLKPIGELVMVKNRLELLCDSKEFISKNKDFLEQMAYFNHAMAKLKESAARIRFISLGEITAAFRRKTGSLAAKEHKRINLYLSGLDVRIDRITADLIKDMLWSLIYGIAEYGMDRMEVRRRQGKSSKGSVYLHAWAEDYFVVIQIHDDGNGTDIGLEAEPDCGLNLRQIRSDIENLGGEFFSSFMPQKGSKFRIKIPVPKETMDAFVIEVHEEIYVIGMEYVLSVEDIENTDILDESGNKIPLIYIDERLHIRSKKKEKENAKAVIVKKGSRCAGLAVDAVRGCQEAVIRPLSSMIRKDPLIGGAVILKDGRPALVLDVSAWI